jgi:hypothetical protein
MAVSIRNATYGPKLVTNGLVLYLDAGNVESYEPNTPSWNDLSGNGNTGTIVGEIGYSSANGGSIDFDNTGDYITINDSNSLDLTTALTLSLWFNRGDLLTLPVGDQHNLFIKGHSELPPPGDVLNYVIKVTGVYAWTDSGGNTISTSSPPSGTFLANQWYNLVITHVSGSTPIPYLNGVIRTNWTAVNPSNPLQANTYRATISGDVERPSDKGATFNGKIALIQLYNRALTQAEVSQNFYAFRGRFGLY